MEEELVYLAKQKLYSFVALFLSFFILVLCILVSNRRMIKEDKNDPVDKYFSEQKVLIEMQNKKLQSKIDSLNLKLEQNNLKLDKLSKQKTQIKYVYITELQKIDALNNDGIVKEFNNFFSKSNSGQ
jgi:hypothetical protein